MYKIYCIKLFKDIDCINIVSNMNTNDDTLTSCNSNYVMTNIELKNKGFPFIDALFRNNGWHIIRNDFNWIVYSKFGHETEFFEIKIDSNSVHVSMPIKNSLFQYRTSFDNYFNASEYLEERFKQYIS